MSTVAAPRPIHVGDVIGGGFGTVFVALNSQLLWVPLRLVLVLLAVATLALVVVLFVRDRRVPGAATLPMNRRAYLVTVAVMVAALVVGGPVIVRTAPQLSIAWVALVVGLHFVAFAIWWIPGSRAFLAVGGAMTALAVVAAVVGLVGGPGTRDVVALLAGVGSGVVLLGASAPAAVARARA